MALACWTNGNGQDDGFEIGYLIVGSLASWVGSFITYGFGELIERAVSIDNKLKATSVSEPEPIIEKTVPAVKTNFTEEKSKKQEQPPKTYFSDLPDL